MIQVPWRPSQCSHNPNESYTQLLLQAGATIQGLLQLPIKQNTSWGIHIAGPQTALEPTRYIKVCGFLAPNHSTLSFDAFWWSISWLPLKERHQKTRWTIRMKCSSNIPNNVNIHHTSSYAWLFWWPMMKRLYEVTNV